MEMDEETKQKLTNVLNGLTVQIARFEARLTALEVVVTATASGPGWMPHIADRAMQLREYVKVDDVVRAREAVDHLIGQVNAAHKHFGEPSG